MTDLRGCDVTPTHRCFQFDPYFGVHPCDAGDGAQTDLGTVIPLDRPIEASLQPVPGLGSGYITLTATDVIVTRLSLRSAGSAHYAGFDMQDLHLDRGTFLQDPMATLLAGLGDVGVPPQTAAWQAAYNNVASGRTDTAPQIWAFGLNDPLVPSIFAAERVPDDLPDAGELPVWRDGLIDAATSGAADDFQTQVCMPLDKVSSLPAPTNLDPVKHALRQSLAMVNTTAFVWRPSAIAALLEFPALATKLTETARHAKSCPGLSAFGIGVLMTSLAHPDGQARFMAAFRAADWQLSDWIGWGQDRGALKQIMAMLSDDALVADLDQTFGQGAALRLGQRVTARLRDKRRTMHRLTAQTQVMGRA